MEQTHGANMGNTVSMSTLHLNMSNVDVVLMYVCIYLSLNLKIASETGLTSTNATQIHLLCITFKYIYIYLCISLYIHKVYNIHMPNMPTSPFDTFNGGSQETPINGRAEWCNLGPKSVYNLPNKYRKKWTILKRTFHLPTSNIFQPSILREEC